MDCLPPLGGASVYQQLLLLLLLLWSLYFIQHVVNKVIFSKIYFRRAIISEKNSSTVSKRSYLWDYVFIATTIAVVKNIIQFFHEHQDPTATLSHLKFHGIPSWSSQNLGSAIHLLTTDRRFGFSRAAATRSLSCNCLLIAVSWSCLPGVIERSILYSRGRVRSSLT